jgi:DNA-binding response OmpR family regulator
MARILVIDDEAELRRIIRIALEQAGHEVIEARNGEDGLRQHDDATADLIITDIMMPETDGIETIIALRRHSPRIKIIAISGGGRVGDTNFLTLAAKFGADQVLAKPFRREQLLETVRACLAMAA